MKCISCGTDLPDGARYCPNCGTVNERQVTVPPQKPKMKPWVYATAILGGVGLVALVFAGVVSHNRSITSLPGGTPPPGQNILSAPPGTPGNGNLMSAPPGTPGNGQTTPGATPKPKPTPAMVDYLNYVKGVETKRQELLKDTTNALAMSQASGSTQSLLNLVDMACDPDSKEARDPLQDVKDELKRQYTQWRDLLIFFDKKPAPPECREFSAAYRNVLYKEADAIGQMWNGFQSVNMMDPNDMKKLLGTMQKMKGDRSIQGNIDTAADTADGSLNKMVSTYDMQKPFDVPREQQTSGNIMGF